MMIRFLLRRTVSGLVLVGAFLTAQGGFAQVTPALTSSGQAASQPARLQAAASSDQAPLTPRERQLLQQVQDLQARVAALEEKVSKTPDSQSVEKRLAALEQKITPDSYREEERLAALKVTKPPDSQPMEATASDTKAALVLAKQVAAQSETNQKETGNQETSQKEIGQGKAAPPPVYVPPAMEGTQGGGEQSAAAANATTFGFQERKKFGAYTPNYGFTVADTNYGSMNISIFSYVRYLNQLDLNPTYTNASGTVSNVQQRHSFQLNKVQMKFLGWVGSPKLRYFLYVWTSNSNQGQGAQVVAAGNLNYDFNKHLTLSGGINALPGTRSVEGNFPFWLGEDSRLIADEFFRGSYTSGIWAKGEINWRLRYQVMLGNNLSTLGVNAGQLNHLSTVASALVWMPSTGEFGAGFGDYENHEKLATRVGIHFSRSTEDKQSQPDSEVFDNTQIRLSDGTVIFTPNLFGPGITVDKVRYRMTSFDGGVKYHGYALEGEYFMRWLDKFVGPGTQGLPRLFDNGLQIQPSAMVVPKTLQIYLGGSQIFGKYGNPFDARIGANWFPFGNRVLRWNTEALYLYKSPVGYFAVPFSVGGKGWVFHSNVELAF